MSDKESNAQTNDSLQSGENRPAAGEDARSFGQGGQVVQRAFEPGHKDSPDREADRDKSVPEFDSPEGNGR